MAPKRSNPAGQDHEERPQKRSRRLADLDPEYEGLTKSDFARKPPGAGSKGGSPKSSTHKAQKPTGSAAPSRRELIKRYARLNLADLQDLYEAFLNGEPPASKGALAEAIADHRLSSQRASCPEKPPTLTPHPPTPQGAPSSAAPNSSPPPLRPGQEWGSPDLTLKDINGENACENSQTLAGFWINQYRNEFGASAELNGVLYLQDSHVHRAITALTEALEGEFSLTSLNSFNIAGAADVTPQECQSNLARLVRPRKPVVIGYSHDPKSSLGIDATGQSGHHFLVTASVENGPDNRHLPRIRIYDSIPTYFTKDERDSIVRNVHRRLRNLQWFTWPGLPALAHPFLDYEMVPVPPQRQLAACGILTVVNGWCAALGLHPKPDADCLKDKDFDKNIRVLINLALWGYLDTRTIFSYLKCEGYIEEDDELRPEFDVQLRRFPGDRTQVDSIVHDYYMDRLIEETTTTTSQDISENSSFKGMVLSNVESPGWADRLRRELHRGPLKVPWDVLNALTDEALDIQRFGWKYAPKEKDGSIAWATLFPDLKSALDSTRTQPGQTNAKKAHPTKAASKRYQLHLGPLHVPWRVLGSRSDEELARLESAWQDQLRRKQITLDKDYERKKLIWTLPGSKQSPPIRKAASLDWDRLFPETTCSRDHPCCDECRKRFEEETGKRMKL